ncbi:uncharacterized protein LOC117781029 [Drosophila innubila]|uniref:uncharacterized protein LOC117781029 n=1 Tax=Drosophila innubila TaxID=198719 RepID=UPI00148B65C4|nr:uncharacterized protein LOC117781029 [Drosophila innubila]
MLPAAYRKIFLKKLLISTVGLFLILYIVRFQVPKLNKIKTKSVPVYFNRPRLQLEQNGDYWIYNNFMRSSSADLRGNMSITLTTHGTYRDFKHMKWLLVRWSAPISMAVYVNKNDFQELLDSLYHIKYCTIFSVSWFHWVSLQLVFHDKHMPEILHRISSEHPYGFRCKQFNNNETKYMLPLANHRRYTDYPLNLLRNVARLNAQTYYVFALEPGMLPTRGFVMHFLQFVHLYQTKKSRKSIYCLPVFPPIFEDAELPKYKSDLKDRLEPCLNGSIILPPTNNAQLNKFRHWLLNPVIDGDIAIYKVSKQPQYCSAYISSNAYEPLYDQRYEIFSSDPNFLQLDVLVSLGFDFVILDGTFVIRRHSNWQADASSDVPYSSPSAQKLKRLDELIRMNALMLGNPYRETN